MKKKELDKFLELASLEDLRSFARNYAKTHKPFERDLTDFLAEKYLDEDDGARRHENMNWWNMSDAKPTCS